LSIHSTVVLVVYFYFLWSAGVEDGLLYVLRTTVPVVRSCRNVVLGSMLVPHALKEWLWDYVV